MKYAFGTDVGKKRTNNEDALYVWDQEPDSNLYIVADGMGGHNAGEVASKNVIQIVSSMLCDKEINLTQEAIVKAIESANSSIYEMSKKEANLTGMGTTIVAATATKDWLTIAHVGDSRAYLISKKKIKRLTLDHSWVQELINTGALKQSEAKDHPHKNVITRAIGTGKDVKVDVAQHKWAKGDILLLCTDGLTTYAEDEDIVKIINKNNDLNTAVKELIDFANNSGGSDNITVVLVLNNVSEEKSK